MAARNAAEREEMEAEEDPRGAEGEGTSTICERRRKRRRVEDKYKAFDNEEKEVLKKYEELESRVRATVKATYKKLLHPLFQGEMAEGVQYLKERLESLMKKTSLDPVRIGFLGVTGAGKSSLINAILGRDLFLPVSSYKTCTSCTVHVKRSTNDFYEATIHFISEQEWKDELKKYMMILDKTEDDGDDEDETDDSVKEVKSIICTIYGEGAENKAYEDLLKMKMKVTFPSNGRDQIKETRGEELSRKLGPYVRTQNQDSSIRWPLVNYVEVTVPGLDMLPDGITFVDIPGTGDFNSKRDEMWKESIATCSVLWIISAIDRAVGLQAQELLLKESIKACVSGNCTDIALVVTKSDDLTFKTYRSEKGGDTPFQNKHDAILDRNETVKKEKEKSIKEKLKRKLPPDSDIINKPNLVYTVSANEFCEPEHLSPEETEIPKLREYIREIFLKEKKKLVTEYVMDAYGIHQLAENFGSEELLVDQHFQESGVEEFVNKEIDTLRHSLERCFSELEQPLCDGVEHAKRSYKNTVNKFLTKENGYQGYHKTLKAVCLKNGVYASRTFARIDLNEDLARPIYNKIDGNFDNIFRTRRPTRQSLWPQLEAFKNEVNKKIDEIGKRHRLSKNKTDSCTRENEVILTNLKKEILRRKKAIYDTLPLSIQNNLKPHYEAASKVRGAKACDQMKTILRENVQREVKNKMFEKAKSKMNSYFLELKEEIVKMLKKDVSIVLKLALLQQKQLAVKLPDIEKECRAMKNYYESL